jgi:hypothetical protein
MIDVVDRSKQISGEVTRNGDRRRTAGSCRGRRACQALPPESSYINHLDASHGDAVEYTDDHIFWLLKR